jgi:hypothetical protein
MTGSLKKLDVTITLSALVGFVAQEFDSRQVYNCMKSHSKKNHYGDY